MKSIFIRSLAGSPRASATNIGPRAEPPMPMDSTRVNRGAVGGRMSPPCTPAANDLTSATVLRISRGDFRRRRQVRRAQPVVPHHAVLVRIGDGPALQRVHGLEGPLDRLGHPVEEAVVEPHPADVQRQPERRDAAQVLLKSLPQNLCIHRLFLTKSVAQFLFLFL